MEGVACLRFGGKHIASFHHVTYKTLRVQELFTATWDCVANMCFFAPCTFRNWRFLCSLFSVSHFRKPFWVSDKKTRQEELYLVHYAILNYKSTQKEHDFSCHFFNPTHNTYQMKSKSKALAYSMCKERYYRPTPWRNQNLRSVVPTDHKMQSYHCV